MCVNNLGQVTSLCGEEGGMKNNKIMVLSIITQCIIYGTQLG